jgi:ABC-type branched-subunit amino acid transport system substrate-binding protein
MLRFASFVSSRLLLWAPAVALVITVLAFAGLPGRAAPGYDTRTAVGDAWSAGGFTIAVVWPPNAAPDFVEGVRLAWEEVDRGSSPLAGKIRLRVVPEPSRYVDDVSRQIARDGHVIAVLGNAASEHVVPASLIYEQHSIVYITPQATDPRSTSHAFQYVFRLTPSDVEIATALAHFALASGFKRVGILYAQTEHGDSASRQFEAKATSLGLRVPFERSYHATRDDWSKQDFRQLAAEVRAVDIDALMIADELPLAGKLVRDLVEMGVTQPILATDKLDSAQLLEIAGRAAGQVHVASPFDASSTTPAYVAFRTHFAQRYRVDPGYAAAQGYESFMLIANSCLASKTAAPLVLATTIRLAPSWHGLFGEFSFKQAGGVLGRQVSIKRVESEESRARPEYTWKEEATP